MLSPHYCYMSNELPIPSPLPSKRVLLLGGHESSDIEALTASQLLHEAAYHLMGRRMPGNPLPQPAKDHLRPGPNSIKKGKNPQCGRAHICRVKIRKFKISFRTMTADYKISIVISIKETPKTCNRAWILVVGSCVLCRYLEESRGSVILPSPCGTFLQAKPGTAQLTTRAPPPSTLNPQRPKKRHTYDSQIAIKPGAVPPLTKAHSTTPKPLTIKGKSLPINNSRGTNEVILTG
jgi:hypothetical protein